MTKRSAFLMLLPILLLPLRPVAATTTTSDCVEPFEAEVAHLINVEREQRGLARLAIVDTLSASSEHMVQSYSHYGYTGHVLASGTRWADNQRNHGYTYNTWRGQNVGIAGSAERIVELWMGSGPHRDMILNPNFRVLGSGYTKGGDGVRYWAVDFGGVRDTKADWC